MPTNLPKEYYVKEAELKNAKTIEEKIKILEELISITPKHKGTENLIANLRKRIAKLREEKERKKSKKAYRVKEFEKVGDFIVSIVGIEKSGKTTLLNKLTNSNYTTTRTISPQYGILNYKGAKIQVTEVPYYCLEKYSYILKSSDLIIFLFSKTQDIEKQNELKNLVNNLNKKIIQIDDFSNIEKIKEDIWNELDLIEVFVKKPLKKEIEFNIGIKKDSCIKDLMEKINLKTEPRFIKIFRNDKILIVGKNYKLMDKDIVEFHL
ncbi:MAG: GTPase [Candidatus Aenigmarchaeota archaeon]|nr:50S ribosome-binding GTPase [Candidatus Aenigmarchaeota archaeon]MDW8149360.1 GTPase [Candidatus Aenigmarchaeota archaeon]